ncbi:MAG: SDR family NAD(P)-dependent oxidoreductase, partial [Desulfobacteraceae bacterium]|nr:SDR family NAD(P)-dependent oxidoreductase [Desulfobacteraceae bacterium]
MRFKEKIAVVTGGSTGIGKETINQLGLEGAKVYNLDIVKSENSHCEFIKCDVSDYDQVQSAISEILKQEENIDILFANAGIHHVANIEETSIDDFEKVISVN